MVTLTAKQPKKIGPQAEFNVRELRRSIFHQGDRLTWELASRCPCRERVTVDEQTGVHGAPDADCTACGASGYLYHSAQPILGETTEGRANPKRFEVYGYDPAAMAGITVFSEHLPPMFSRYTMVDTVMVMSETRLRGATVEALAYPVAVRALELGSDEDPTEGVVVNRGVLHCTWANDDGEIVVDGDDDPKVAVEGVDFEVTDDGEMDWTLGDVTGNAPAVGQRYSTDYYYHPAYICVGYPRSHRNTWIAQKAPEARFANLPVRLDVVLEHIFRGRA